MTQRVADQFGRDVDNLNHPIVSHAGGADHAEGSHDHTVHLIWRTDDRQLLEGDDLTLPTNVDAHPVGLTGYIEQAHQLRLLLEEIERASQVIEVTREITDRQQVTRSEKPAMSPKRTSFFGSIGALGGAGSGGVRFGSTSCGSKPQTRLPSETAFVFTKSTALSASPFALSLAFAQPSYNLLGGFDLSPARTSAIASDS